MLCPPTPQVGSDTEPEGSAVGADSPCADPVSRAFAGGVPLRGLHSPRLPPRRAWQSPGSGGSRAAAALHEHEPLAFVPGVHVSAAPPLAIGGRRRAQRSRRSSTGAHGHAHMYAHTLGQGSIAAAVGVHGHALLHGHVPLQVRLPPRGHAHVHPPLGSDGAAAARLLHGVRHPPLSGGRLRPSRSHAALGASQDSGDSPGGLGPLPEDAATTVFGDALHSLHSSWGARQLCRRNSHTGTALPPPLSRLGLGAGSARGRRASARAASDDERSSASLDRTRDGSGNGMAIGSLGGWAVHLGPNGAGLVRLASLERRSDDAEGGTLDGASDGTLAQMPVGSLDSRYSLEHPLVRSRSDLLHREG